MRMHLLVMMVLVLGVAVGGQAEAATHAKKTVHTRAHAVHRQKGRISYYHPKLAGKTMANGEAFRPESNAAASKTLPLGTKAKDMALVMEAQQLAERDIPEYVAPDGNAKVTFTRVPTLDEVPYPVKMEPNLVVEFYSR